VHCLHTDYDYQKQTFAYDLLRNHVFKNGDLGVYFFFVLSGFLITYLLLMEQQLKGKIHVGAFYIRRALRIWPLYYFCVFFGFVIFPWVKSMFGEMPSETANPIRYVFFLSNFDIIRNGMPDSSVLSVLWSISVEEQFYLAWPLILFVVPKKHYPKVFLFIIGGSLTYRYFNHRYPDSMLHTFCVISDMAIGGLSAWLILHAPRFRERISHIPRWGLYVLYGVLLFFFLFRHAIFVGVWGVVPERIILAIVFALVILEQNFCENSFFKMKNLTRITRLGKYAYGLYCLHFIAILIQVRTGLFFGFTSQWWVLLFGPLLALSLTIGIAILSYHLFEERFLKLKDKFAFVIRGSK
jgi:peptidoglycan/LPS O-acetylase OafA/YrhL